MREALVLVISLLLSGGPCSALVGADVADRTVQRFTVVVAGARTLREPDPAIPAAPSLPIAACTASSG